MYENSHKETRGALKTGFCEEGLNALKGADLETTYRYRYIEESQNFQKQENKSYIYKDGNLVALTAGTSNAYYSSDIHGSTRQVSDTSGFSESYNYDSFGKPIYKSTYVDYEEGYDLDALFGENTDWQQIDTENTSKNDYRFSSWYQTRTTNVSPYASQYHDYLSVAGYSGKSYNSNTGLNNYGFRDYSSSIGRFITSDPIRDGANWYTLAVNNPINFVDLWGLELAERTTNNTMSDYNFVILGNGVENAKFSDQGCAVTEMANIISSFTGLNITPNILNSDKSNFAENTDLLLMQDVGEKYGLEYDYWTQEKQGDLSTKITELITSDETYYISAQVYYNEKNCKHWVGITDIKTTEEGKTLVKIAPTSKNDTVKANRRRDTWQLDENDDMWVETSDVVKIYTYEVNNKKNN